MKRNFTTRSGRYAVAMVAALTLGLAGCATTSEDVAVDESPATGSEFDQGSTGASDGGSTSSTSADIELATVYFDFDRSDIRADARPILRANAEGLRVGGYAVTIEGHCDDRGSEEYNQALGERRAHAVKRYLENLGVPRSQMSTISYGETRPAVQGHDESAWRYNRNAQFSLRN